MTDARLEYLLLEVVTRVLFSRTAVSWTRDKLELAPECMTQS